MKRTHESLKSYISFLLYMAGLLFFLSSCGVVGPPIPPEDIGIEAKIRAQKQAEEEKIQKDEQQIVPIGEEPISLPPLQRVGSQ